MAEPIDQNGVKFTPEKVINLDDLLTQTSDKTSENQEQEKPEEIEKDVKPEGQDTSNEEPAEAKDAEPELSAGEETSSPEPESNNDTDDIPLDEITFDLGEGKEMGATELLDKYTEISGELEKIKGDAFLNKFLEFYQSGGDPSEFFQKATVKWEGVGDIELMKMKFNEENADLDEDVKQILFERQLFDKYSINPDGTFEDDDSRESKVGKQLLKRDAVKIREAKIEEQKNYLLPQKKDESQQQQAAYDPEKVREELLKDKEVQEFVKKKSLPIGDEFSYEVSDPNKVIGMMANINEFWNLFKKPDGSYDKATIAKVMSFAMDPKRYDDHILKLGRDSGSETYIKEQKNTVERGKTKIVDKSTDRDEVRIVGGKIVSDNAKDGLLKAFVAQRRK
jgi:hypothetical protein